LVASASAQAPSPATDVPASPDNTAAESINPFATPWLLTARPKPKEPEQPAVQPKPLQTKYKLEPDPSRLDSEPAEQQTSQAPATAVTPVAEVSSRTTATAPKPALFSVTKPPKRLAAKYDVTRIGDRGVGDRVNFYSLEREQALGRELSQQVEMHAKLITDPVITEYVNRIGQTLVRHSDAHVAFTIKVVDDEQVNAFALPGGFFYVNSGVLLAADSEAELAGVMAHEIAHVAARHATHNATRQEIWNLASLPLIFVGGPVGAAIRQFSGVVVPMSFLKFSRDDEREADFLGLEYQYASGYDPTAFVDFFEKLEAQEKGHSGFMARAFASHPMNADRIRRAETELQILPDRDGYIVSTSEFDEVRERLIALTRGRRIDSAKPGAPTLRKHTVDDTPPVLRKKPGTIG